MRKSLENYIHNLWHWLKMTPRQYAECCGTGDQEPYIFPEWEKMLDEVCSLIKRGGLFPADMDCLLTMMALDDETEDVLDCLTAQGDELLISVLTHAGLRSIFPQARWQCAELLGRRSIPDGMALLRQYANDRDAYVTKRARNAMKAITGNKNG